MYPRQFPVYSYARYQLRESISCSVVIIIYCVWDLSVLFLRSNTLCIYSDLNTHKKLKTKVDLSFQGTTIGSFKDFCLVPPCLLAECKYQFQAWGECDLNTALKTRTGSLKRALHNADCQKTVTISKPCGKLTKPKPQGSFLPLHHNSNMNALIDLSKKS